MHSDTNRQRNSTRPTHQQKSYQKHSRPWTCVSTGYNAVMPKINSVITGNLERRTWQTTSLSTTQPHTTRVYAPPYWHLSTIRNTGNSSWHKIRHHLRAMSNLAGQYKEYQQKRQSSQNLFCQNSLPDIQVPEHDSSKKCLRILRQGCVRPTSTYGAIRIAHLLVRSKLHQKQACDQNHTLTGAIKIAPKASVRAELHTCWCDRNRTKSVKPTSTYIPNDGKDSRQSHETP